LSVTKDVAAVEYLKTHNTENLWVESDFEAASGVGVHVTEGELQDFVAKYISTNKGRIVEERYKALPTTLKELAANPFIKWADPKLRAEIVNKKFEELLGPKDERDNAPVKKVIPFQRPD
jgi:glutaminyl-tRNA synthetase